MIEIVDVVNIELGETWNQGGFWIQQVDNDQYEIGLDDQYRDSFSTRLIDRNTVEQIYQSIGKYLEKNQ